MLLKRLVLSLRLLALTAIFIMIVAPEWPAFQTETYQLDALIGQRQFDYLVWELKALGAKGDSAITGGEAYLDEAQQQQVVLDYIDLMQQARQLEAEIESTYLQAKGNDAAATTATQSAELAGLREQMAALQSLAESILQEQVAALLVEEGFGVAGIPWPPVAMRFSQVPAILVVSPRERIEQIYSVSLVPGIDVPAREALEEAIYNQLDRSALVVPIGGVGIYPAMVLEQPDINWLAETVAHEWAHHWLTFHPLGIRYGASPTLRTVNETVANIFGNEVGARLVARYYPEYAPPPSQATAQPAPAPGAPPAFDFRAEMAQTRVTVDELLAAGRVKEAEGYMEQRRLVFVNHGYRLRKLNQAYFAFFGAYADTPGETGSDPIGPAVNRLRAGSPTLHDFMTQVATVTDFEKLEQLAGPPTP